MPENNGTTLHRKSEIKRPEIFEAEVPLPTALVGSRHVVTFMLFLGMANAYVMRTNMSVAIVAMVNHTAITEDHDIPTSECGYDNAVNSSSAKSVTPKFAAVNVIGSLERFATID